jgi:hypothetical protein
MTGRHVKIAAVLIVLSVIFLSPFLYSIFTDKNRVPEPVLPKNVKECVQPKDEMRREHMKLLYEWRDDAVRRGARAPIVIAGVTYKKSLTGACIRCHSDKENFCDRCHGALSVAPACWDCHIYRKEPTP